MRITVNGESRMMDRETSIADVLNQMGYAQTSVAVALNGDFVPRSVYGNTQIRDGDTLEIVAPMQGG